MTGITAVTAGERVIPVAEVPIGGFFLKIVTEQKEWLFHTPSDFLQARLLEGNDGSALTLRGGPFGGRMFSSAPPPGCAESCKIPYRPDAIRGHSGDRGEWKAAVCFTMRVLQAV